MKIRACVMQGNFSGRFTSCLTRQLIIIPNDAIFFGKKRKPSGTPEDTVSRIKSNDLLCQIIITTSLTAPPIITVIISLITATMCCFPKRRHTAGTPQQTNCPPTTQAQDGEHFPCNIRSFSPSRQITSRSKDAHTHTLNTQNNTFQM